MLGSTPDFAAARKKRSELISVAFSVLENRDLAVRVVDAMCALSPPVDPPNVIQMMTVYQMGASGGHSRKPGNLSANFGRLIGEFGDIGLATAAGAVDMSLVPLAALSVWSKIWNHSKIQLTREQAILVYAMWLNREAGNLIAPNDALAAYTMMCAYHGLPLPSASAFDADIDALVSFGSIELKASGDIWLREWVKNTYL